MRSKKRKQLEVERVAHVKEINKDTERGDSEMQESNVTQKTDRVKGRFERARAKERRPNASVRG